MTKNASCCWKDRTGLPGFTEEKEFKKKIDLSDSEIGTKNRTNKKRNAMDFPEKKIVFLN